MNDSKTFTVNIDKTLFGGYGLTHHDGKALMVQSAVAGDHVTVKIDKEAPRYKKATVVEWHDPRPTLCKYAKTCGGCPWDGIEHSEQLSWKQGFVSEAFTRAKIEHPEVPLPHSSDLHGVRHRVELQIQWAEQKTILGYYAPKSRDIVDIETCMVTTPAIQKAIEGIRAYQPSKKSVSHYRLHLQELSQGVAVMVKLPLHGRRNAIPNAFLSFLRSLDSVSWAGTQKDSTSILPWEKDLGIEWSTAPGLFQQVHLPLNHELRKLIKSWVETHTRKASHILDLCCGSGNLSLGLASDGRKITGVENNPEAIKVAQHQVTQNNKCQINYETASAEKWLASNTELNFDLVIVDPPRSGLKELIPHLKELNPPAVVMISCDPPTLIRDIKLLGPSWKVTDIQLFDFFPNTWHVETAVLLTQA